MFGVANSLIRYWEGEFPTLKPYKNSKGERRFTPDNIRMIERIYHLVKERGFTLDGARQELKSEMLRQKNKEVLANRLKKLKDQLSELLDRLENEEE